MIDTSTQNDDMDVDKNHTPFFNTENIKITAMFWHQKWFEGRSTLNGIL
jgi:hypothetical protein